MNTLTPHVPRGSIVVLDDTAPGSEEGSHFPHARGSAVATVQYNAEGGGGSHGSLWGRINDTDPWVLMYTFTPPAENHIISVQLMPYMIVCSDGSVTVSMLT